MVEGEYHCRAARVWNELVFALNLCEVSQVSDAVELLLLAEILTGTLHGHACLYFGIRKLSTRIRAVTCAPKRIDSFIR